MPRKNSSRQYIAEGFYNDCEELIQKCLRADIVNYHVFCNIWKDMNFAQLFWGRQLGSELAELSEEAIYVAKAYFVADNNNMEESIAGLFLVYGLMNLQPYPGFAPLRITPDDIVAIKKIEMFARRTNRVDVLFILGSVLINGPVEYHAQMRDFGFEVSIKKYLLGYSGIDMPNQRTTGVLSHRSEELDILREINSLTKKYTESKDILTNAGIWSEKLNYSNSTLATDLNNSFKKVLSGTAYSEHLEDVPGEVSETNSYNHLQSIKNKAMAVTYGTAKHREGVEERKKNREEKALQNLKSPKQTEKTKKQQPKRKFNLKTLRKKRSKVEMSSDSDTDTSISLDESDNQTSDVVETLDRQIEAANKEINIQIESLPVFISMDRNKEYEFEIIDNMQTEKVEQNTSNDIVPKIYKNKRRINNENNDEANEPLTKVRKVLKTTTELELPVVDVTDKEVQENQTAKSNKNNVTQMSNVKNNNEIQSVKESQNSKCTKKTNPKKGKTLIKQKENAAKLKVTHNSILGIDKDIKTKGKEKQKHLTNIVTEKRPTDKVTDTPETTTTVGEGVEILIIKNTQQTEIEKAIHKRKGKNKDSIFSKAKDKDKQISKQKNSRETLTKDDQQKNKQISPKITNKSKIRSKNTQANKKVESPANSKNTGLNVKAKKSNIDDTTTLPRNTRSSLKRHSGTS